LDKIKRCVICNRTSGRKYAGRQLYFYYDTTHKDYHCSLCEELVRTVVSDVNKEEANGQVDWSYHGWYSRSKNWQEDNDRFFESLDWDLDNIPDDWNY
jgi:hypothetical protein